MLWDISYTYIFFLIQNLRDFKYVIKFRESFAKADYGTLQLFILDDNIVIKFHLLLKRQ